MDLIDKGTHLEDAVGNVYAKSDSPPKIKPPKKLKFRPPAYWDTVFGLYVEVRAGKLFITEIAKQMKVPYQTIVSRARTHGWNEKADTIIRKRTAATDKTIATKASDVMASSLATGQNEFRENVSEMLVRASQSVKKMKAATYLRQTKEVKEMVDTAEKVQGWKKEEDKSAATAPVLNIAFLLGESMKPVVSASPAT